MRKSLSVLLVLALCFSILTACKQSPTVQTTAPTVGTTVPAETVAPTVTTTPTESIVEPDPPGSEGVPIFVARDVDDGKQIRTSGVVAKITYSYGMVPSGFLLVDGTDAIYVYGSDIASQVKEGNHIVINGTKTHWVLESEQADAATYGYKGCNQIIDAVIEKNDNATSPIPTAGIVETTVKALMDTQVSEDIASQIYKVTALIKKVEGTGFTNYYINDLDDTTGSYVYTQCNGSDFAWLDAYDGKICTVYLTPINAKSTASGCFWRFLPVLVEDTNFDVSTVNVAKFAVEYFGLPQFQLHYSGDPALALQTSVSSSLLNFSDANLSYLSDNESVISFRDNTMHCNASGTANITVTGSFGEQTYSVSITITVSENSKTDHISVTEAIASEVGETVVVKGIVGPSLVNRDGFYLIDDEALIAITTDKETLDSLQIGNEIVIEGTRDRFHDGFGNHAGQTAITHCTVIANYYGEHAYCTDFFIEGTSLADFYTLDPTVDYSTSVFILKARVEVIQTAYYTKIQLTDGKINVTLYCSGANQYAFLKGYHGQEVTVELAPCNWNNKNFWAGCVLAVYNEDGSKIINEVNFK